MSVETAEALINGKIFTVTRKILTLMLQNYFK